MKPSRRILTAVLAELDRRGDGARSRLAEETGIRLSDISRWIHGHRTLNERSIERVIAALGLTIAPSVRPKPRSRRA